MCITINTYRITLVLLVFYNGASSLSEKPHRSSGSNKNILSGLSDKRLCADPECKVPISLARGKITYTAAEEGRVSFTINSSIRVMSKSAGSNPSLWGIEVQGRKGYAPSEYILEEKMLVNKKDVKYEVAVEPMQDATKIEMEIAGPSLSPSEIIVEEKVSSTEIPATEQLISATEPAPLTLNASESEVKATTAHQFDGDVNFVNQSLPDVTPVIKSFEVIDGTSIPVVEETAENPVQEMPEKATVVERDLKRVNSNEPQTTNEKSIANKSDDKSEKTESTKDKTLEAKANVDEERANIKKEALKANPHKFEDNLAITKEEENKVTLNIEYLTNKLEQTERAATETDTQREIADGDIASTTGTTDPKNNNTPKAFNEESADNENEHISLRSGETNLGAIDMATNVTTSKNPKDLNHIPPNVDQPESFLSNDVLEHFSGVKMQDSQSRNEIGSFADSNVLDDDDGDNNDDDDGDNNDDDDDNNDDDDGDNNDDDDGDDVQDKNVDSKEHNIDIPSTTVESTTEPINQLFTEQGHEAVSMKNYWENRDEIDTTTPTSQIIVERPTTESAKDTQTKDAQRKEEDDKVPFMPTTLPIFQQPIVSSVYQKLQNEENSDYENPNDYYLHQDLKQKVDNSNEERTHEHLSSKAIKQISESLSVNNEQFSTQPAETTEEKSLNENKNNLNEMSTDKASIETISSTSLKSEQQIEASAYTPIEEKREAGLFIKILGTVNNFVSKLSKKPQKRSQEMSVDDEELQQILYPEKFESNKYGEHGEQYCENISPHECPQQQHKSFSFVNSDNQQCNYDWSHVNMNNFGEIFLAKAFEMRELLSCLIISASASLLFLFGYYCYCNSSREGALISKLNQLERSLLASHKENAILKDDLMKTRSKLTSIEDNSFGSNDMVIALKKELEVASAEKVQLQEHVHSLEKELESAAEAGLELNKIVAELLNNQSGQETMIMNSVEDLQLQFNEQQKTILEINANLAEKSRENSELQLMLTEQNVRFKGEITALQQDNDELEAEKANLQTRLEEIKTEYEEDITKALEGKNVEIKRLQNEILEVKKRYEEIHTKYQTSLAKIEALEDCMKTMKKDPSVNITDIINMANVKADLSSLQQQRTSLKNLLETETEARQHAENSLKNTIIDLDRLKQNFHQSEKDKLEAQTRLEVLSNYFKEKETQLQKELSLKEAIWLKQQGENTSTVDRMTAMQEEIQSLKSQNDALRAEIEAQIAAHKAQTGTLENRAHETWLAARQSERRYEEARAEAAALRRRLTELADSTNSGDVNRATIEKIAATELPNAPSPILPPPILDTAGSPLLGRLPPPQFMPFMGPPPPPFLNLPPPSFLSSVEMRPAPLGRMMSPPLGRYSLKRDRDGSNYYDDDYDYDDDDEDYDVDGDDVNYDDHEDDASPRHRRHRRRSGSYRDCSPRSPDRSYRSHSPADSRYTYRGDRDLISTYETDLSPPSSPKKWSGIRGGDSRTGVPNSDSDKSYNSIKNHQKKGKSMV